MDFNHYPDNGGVSFVFCQGGSPFCSCLVFWSIVCNSPYRRLTQEHLECKSLGGVSPKGRSFTAKSGPEAAVLLGMNRCGSFPLLSAPHSIFSIWADLKRSEKIPGAPAWRWGEWIWLTGPSGLHRNSPQELNISFIMFFFLPDQGSGNPNHPSPPVLHRGGK